MSRVDGPHTVVRVVGSAHAEAEGTGGPERRGPPVIVIVSKTVHAL